MTGLERNLLERKLKLARKAARETRLIYDVLLAQQEKAFRDWQTADGALSLLQREKQAVIQLEEDLAGKHGPLLSLSRGRCVLNDVTSSEAWPKVFKQVRIRLRPLGDTCRSYNIDLRENGRFGDVFTDEDLACVFTSLPHIEGGEQALAFYHSWRAQT